MKIWNLVLYNFVQSSNPTKNNLGVYTVYMLYVVLLNHKYTIQTLISMLLDRHGTSLKYLDYNLTLITWDLLNLLHFALRVKSIYNEN